MELKLYSRDTCSPCRMLKQYLDKKGVDYTVVNVDEKPDEFAQVVALSGVTIVSQLAYGMTIVTGLNLPRIIELLDAL